MNHAFHTQGISRSLIVAALFLAGGFPSAPIVAAPRGLDTIGQAKTNAGNTGPGFVLVNVHRASVALFPNDSGTTTDRQGNVYTTRWDSVQAVHGEYVLKVNLLVVATSPGGTDARVTYGNERRPEVTLAAVTPPPQEPPKPAEKPVAPPHPKTTPAPERVGTPEVTPKPPEKPTPPPPPEKPASAGQRFDVYNLGDGTNILQSAKKPSGILTVGGGKLKYQEAGKTVFTAIRGEIKEISANTVLGYNTGTFKVTLKSGKTYNFAPASLSVADGQKMLESIKQALP